MYNQEFKKFEKELQDFFKRIIKELPKDSNWNILVNQKIRTGSNCYEADAIITKDETNNALVEICQTRRYLPRRLPIIRKTAEVFKCKKIFIVFSDGFFFLNTALPNDYLTLIPLEKEIIKRYVLNDFNEEFNQRTWKDFFDGLAENLSNNFYKKGKVADVLKEIGQCKPEIESDRLIIPEQLEEKFFKSLVKEFSEEKLCRFTSFGSFFRAINEHKQSLCSVVCMNDKSEINYVSNFLQKNHYIQTKLHPGTVGDANQSFILSCCSSKMNDKLTMMRLYADDAKGVIINYKVLDKNRLKSSPNFILRWINYQRKDGTHPELELIGNILIQKFGGLSLSFRALLKWSHFFKPKEYSIEKEVRLLYTDVGKKRTNCVEPKWIHDNTYNILSQIRLFDISNKGKIFPFAIQSIILGPKMRETLINQEQLENLIKDKDIKVAKGLSGSLVDISKIDHYR